MHLVSHGLSTLSGLSGDAECTVSCFSRYTFRFILNGTVDEWDPTGFPIFKCFLSLFLYFFFVRGLADNVNDMVAGITRCRCISLLSVNF